MSDIGQGVRRIDVHPAVQDLLRPEERVIRIAKIHWGIYWKSTFTGIVALLLLINPAVFPLGVFMSFVTVIMFAFATLYKHFLLLVLTDKRVFLRHGIVRLDMIQIRHSRIESVETERTIPGMILGFAALVIYGTGSRRTAIPFIADALEFRNELDEMLSAYEDKVTSAEK